MQFYYKNAILAIAVDSAAGDNEGFLHKKRHNEQPLATLSLATSGLPNLTKGISAYHTSADKIFVRKVYGHGPSEEPLHKRAWTLQENILSPRIIHYASQELQWDCRKRVAYESELAPAERGSLYKKMALLSPFQPMQQSRVEVVAIFDSLCTVWYKIVNDYANRALNIPFDKFPAISGIAREFHQRTNATYQAGLWLEDLHRGLLWSCQGRGQKVSHYRAPSWSWGSRDTLPDLKVHFTHNLYDFFINDLTNCPPECTLKAELIDCQTALQDNDPYGVIVGGRLTLRSYWISWANGKRHGKDIAGFSPPAINRYDGPFISNRDLRESGSEEKIICSFDEYHDDEISDVFRNLSLLQVALWTKTAFTDLGCPNYARQFALLLEPAAGEGEDGHFRRVGIAELPSIYDKFGFDTDGWEARTVTIV